MPWLNMRKFVRETPEEKEKGYLPEEISVCYNPHGDENIFNPKNVTRFFGRQVDGKVILYKTDSNFGKTTATIGHIFAIADTVDEAYRRMYEESKSLASKLTTPENIIDWTQEPHND